MLINKKLTSERLYQFLTVTAKKKGLTDADIASKLEVSIWTVLSWKTKDKSKRRFPKVPMIERIEDKFNVKLA